MKTCMMCSSEHHRPRSDRCLKCEILANRLKYAEKNKEKLRAYAKAYREKNKDLCRERIKRSMEKKKNPQPFQERICIQCSGKNERPKSDICLACERKKRDQIYAEKHKESLKEYAKSYRETNWEKVLESRKRCYHKNKEHYQKKSLEMFIKKRGLPSDYKRWKNPAGRGNISSSGYRIITCPDKDHPNTYDSKGRIAEHTWVMTQHIGRPLHKGETVHHINGDRLDNRLENLELWHRSHPPGQRVEDKLSWCLDFLTQYLSDDQFRQKIVNWVKSRHELG